MKLICWQHIMKYQLYCDKPKRSIKKQRNLTIRADGVVNVRLQYGSDGDMRRGDGYETQMDFPFTSEFIVNYKNQNGNIYIESAEIKVDNNSFFE